eukprot:tig00000478_g1267.t1
MRLGSDPGSDGEERPKNGRGSTAKGADKRGSKAGGSEDEPIYEIERIVDVKKVKGRKKYLVKWEGYPEEENTWEPESNLKSCQFWIDQFERERKEEKAAEKAEKTAGKGAKAKPGKGGSKRALRSAEESSSSSEDESKATARKEGASAVARAASRAAPAAPPMASLGKARGTKPGPLPDQRGGKRRKTGERGAEARPGAMADAEMRDAAAPEEEFTPAPPAHAPAAPEPALAPAPAQAPASSAPAAPSTPAIPAPAAPVTSSASRRARARKSAGLAPQSDPGPSAPAPAALGEGASDALRTASGSRVSFGEQTRVREVDESGKVVGESNMPLERNSSMPQPQAQPQQQRAAAEPPPAPLVDMEKIMAGASAILDGVFPGARAEEEGSLEPAGSVGVMIDKGKSPRPAGDKPARGGDVVFDATAADGAPEPHSVSSASLEKSNNTRSTSVQAAPTFEHPELGKDARITEIVTARKGPDGTINLVVKLAGADGNVRQETIPSSSVAQKDPLKVIAYYESKLHLRPHAGAPAPAAAPRAPAPPAPPATGAKEDKEIQTAAGAEKRAGEALASAWRFAGPAPPSGSPSVPADETSQQPATAAPSPLPAPALSPGGSAAEDSVATAGRLQDGTRVTYATAAQIILREQRQPLHYKEIAKLAAKQGLLPDKASLETSMFASINGDIGKQQDRSVYVRYGPGTFALKEWNLPALDPSAAGSSSVGSSPGGGGGRPADREEEELRRRLEAAEGRAARLARELEAERGKTTDQGEKIRATKLAISRATGESDELRLQLEEARDEARRARQEAAALGQQLEEERKKSSELETRVVELTARDVNEDLKRRFEELARDFAHYRHRYEGAPDLPG